MLTQRPLAAGSSDEGGTWQMAVAVASWRPVRGDDCLYIGFHLCIGLIFIFLRCPDAMVIDWLETTHLSGFHGGRRFPSRVQWSLKCLIRCRGISAWVPSAAPHPHPRWMPFRSLERIWRFLGLTSSPFIFSWCSPHCFLLWAAVFFSPCRSRSRNRHHVTARICRADSCWKPSCQTGPNQTLWNNVVELIRSERNINYLPLICFIPAQLFQKTYLVLTTCQAVP